MLLDKNRISCYLRVTKTVTNDANITTIYVMTPDKGLYTIMLIIELFLTEVSEYSVFF